MKKKHKMLQIDGNDSILDEKENENPGKVKITFIAIDKEDAESDIRDYYLPELSKDTFEISFHEDESGEIYDGTDHCYNDGNYRKYVFSLKLDGAFSFELLKTKLLLDALIDISVIL